jgi:hypothetical protein
MVDAIAELSSATLTSDARQALQWFNQEVKGLRFRANVFQNKGMPEIGKMYLFVYDPKYKETLPFFDAFPLTIPIQYYNDGFLGLNLHYLPPAFRSSLFEQLLIIKNNDKFDTSTKLNVTYKLLKNSSTRFAGFQNCVKRYLFNHRQSSFSQIHPQFWAYVVLLPLQNWKINPDRKYSNKASPPY